MHRENIINKSPLGVFGLVFGYGLGRKISQWNLGTEQSVIAWVGGVQININN